MINKNYIPENKTNKVKKIIKYGLIVIVIMALIVIVSLYLGNRNARLWINKNILKRDIGEEDLPNIQINNENAKVFSYGDKVAILEKGNISIYSASTKKLTDIPVSLSNPIYDTQGNYLLLADKDGSNFYLINNENLMWQKSVDGKITKITVNKNGDVGIVVTATTYKSIIIMYDSNGTECFRTYLGSTLATDMAISNNSKNLSFIEINTTGVSIISKVKTISIEKAKNDPNNAIINTYDFDTNVLAIKIKYNNNDIMLLTDTSLYKLENGNTKKIEDIDADASYIDITLNKNIAEIKENKSKEIRDEYELDFINDDDQKINTYYFGDTIKNMICFDDKVALNFGSQIEFVNTRGNLVKRYTSLKNIKDVQLTSKIATIIYKDSVEIIEL